MAEVIDKRVTAEIDGAFVVFLIGMSRSSRPYAIHLPSGDQTGANKSGTVLTTVLTTCPGNSGWLCPG
jgi:hypothetical protein